MKDGLIDSVDPKIDRLRDWVYGGEDFFRRVLSMAEGDDPVSHRRRVRRANPVSVGSIFEADPIAHPPKSICLCESRMYPIDVEAVFRFNQGL